MRSPVRLASPVRFAFLAALLVACGGDSGSPDGGAGDLAPPPAVCRTPTAPAEPWFTDVTPEMLAGPNSGFLPIATTLHSGDLDGDGWADLIATAPGPDRDTDTMRTRFVFMNRPAPDDPTGRRRIFVDATKSSNLLATRDGKGGYSFGIANLGDVDNDGTLDVVVAPASDSSDPGAVMLNDGKGHFKLAPKGWLETNVNGFSPASAALVDLDRDGILDYVPATFQYPPPNQNPPMLLKGSGHGDFMDMAVKWGISGDSGDPATGMDFPAMYGVTACDLDGDGDQDLLFADYGRSFNRVYRNDGGHFTEIGQAIGVWSDDRMDYSDDQSYLCYCQNRPGKCDPKLPMPEAGICAGFGGQDGRGWFPGQSDQPWRLGGNNFSITCGDLDDDGDMDLMTANIRHGDVGSASDPSELVLNDTPPGQPLQKFVRPGNAKTGIDRPEKGIYWNEGDMTPVFVDLDGDGKKDIYLTSSDYPGDHGWAWHQKPDHTFEDVTKISGIGQKEAHGIAFADFDHDGAVDVAIGTSTFRNGAPTAAIHVYRNNAAHTANYLQVELVGAGAGHTNRSAIGARVKVTAGGHTQMQEVSGGYGHTATQNDLVLTFGLGTACAIDEVEVRWLDAAATTEKFKDVRANYRIRITEGHHRVDYQL